MLVWQLTYCCNSPHPCHQPPSWLHPKTPQLRPYPWVENLHWENELWAHSFSQPPPCFSSPPSALTLLLLSQEEILQRELWRPQSCPTLDRWWAEQNLNNVPRANMTVLRHLWACETLQPSSTSQWTSSGTTSYLHTSQILLQPAMSQVPDLHSLKLPAATFPLGQPWKYAPESPQRGTTGLVLSVQGIFKPPGMP